VLGGRINILAHNVTAMCLHHIGACAPRVQCWSLLACPQQLKRNASGEDCEDSDYRPIHAALTQPARPAFLTDNGGVASRQ
jgi:hypothetical protein